ncbi:MAG: hybrid sensor histidine kinase/response regulator [Rhodoferax sp.]
MTSLRERAARVRVASGIGMVVGSLFGLFNLVTPGQAALGWTELAAVALFVVPAWVLSREQAQVFWAELSLILSSYAIFGALIVFGGVEGTGIYWVYTVPFLAFFIKEQREGWAYSLGFIALVLAYLVWFAPHWGFSYHYSGVEVTQYLLSLGFYTLLAAAFNKTRMIYAMQLQKAKERAEEDVVAKSRFLAAASHDLRQPAHALGMFVARLSQLQHDQEARELVAGVDASVRALQHMLDEFFDYSRLGLPTMQVRSSDFPVERMFAPLRESFASQAAVKGIRLRVRPTRAWVHADPAVLQRVMYNLVANAIQYTPQGGVLVACRSVDGGRRVRLEVWDTGVGIAMEDQQRVFSEFFQVSNPERDRSKGFGLGLSIVKLSCEWLGAHLSLRSQPGRGSRFAVVLPQVDAGEPPAPGAGLALGAHAEAGVTDTDSAVVLVVEDDPLGSAAMDSLLKGWGCEVHVAHNASQAQQMVRAGLSPQFLITDYRLPGELDGLQAVHALRESLGRSLPACVVSGDTDPAVRETAAGMGVAVLQKPVRPAKLRSVMRNALRSGSA